MFCLCVRVFYVMCVCVCVVCVFVCVCVCNAIIFSEKKYVQGNLTGQTENGIRALNPKVRKPTSQEYVRHQNKSPAADLMIFALLTHRFG